MSDSVAADAQPVPALEGLKPKAIPKRKKPETDPL